MFKKDDKVHVVKNGSEDFCKSGVVIDYVGKTRPELLELVGKEESVYAIQLNGEKDIKLFFESELELISKS